MSLYVPNFAEVLAVSRAHGQDSEAPHWWDSVRSCWTMLQGGGKIVYDIGGLANHGIPTNFADISAAWAPGPQGYGLDFGGDNSGDHIQLTNRLVLASGEPWTISCWADIDSLYDYGGLFGHTYSSGEYTRLLMGATAATLYSDDGTDIWGEPGTIQTGLHQYVWTRDGINVDGYRDGVFIERTVVAAKAMTLFRLGTYGIAGSSDDALDGKGISWSVHDRSLSPSELQFSYERPNAMFTLRRRVFPAAVAAGGFGGRNQIIGSGLVA